MVKHYLKIVLVALCLFAVIAGFYKLTNASVLSVKPDGVSQN
jgi:hypothetical protein